MINETYDHIATQWNELYSDPLESAQQMIDRLKERERLLGIFFFIIVSTLPVVGVVIIGFLFGDICLRP